MIKIYRFKIPWNKLNSKEIIIRYYNQIAKNQSYCVENSWRKTKYIGKQRFENDHEFLPVQEWHANSWSVPYFRLSCSSNREESGCDAGDQGLIPGVGRSSGERNGNPLQYSCLENPMDRGAWRATAHGVAKSWTWLSTQLLLLLCTVFYWASPFCIPTNNIQVFQLLCSLASTAAAAAK